MTTFNPQEGEALIRIIDAYDAMREFIHLNYGALAETSEGLANLSSDIDRTAVPGGYPPDESTWGVWIEACNHVSSKTKYR